MVHDAEQALLKAGTAVQGAQGKRAVRSVFEQGLRQYLKPCEHVGLSIGIGSYERRCAREMGEEVEVAVARIACCSIPGRYQQQRIHGPAIPVLLQRPKRILGARQHDVGIGDQKRAVSEMGQGSPHPPSGFQAFVFQADVDGRPRPPFQQALDLPAEMACVDDSARYTETFQRIQHPVQHGPAGNPDQGLRDAVGERPHPLAASGGEHHGRVNGAHGMVEARGKRVRWLRIAEAIECVRLPKRDRNVTVEPLPDRKQTVVAEAVLQQLPGSGQPRQVARLLVPAGQAGEDAEDLG